MFAKWIESDGRFAFSSEDNGGVEVSDNIYQDLFNEQQNGKVITNDGKGNPIAVDEPSLPSNQIIELAAQQKVNLMAEADTYTRPWQTQLLLGIISDIDKASLTTWMKYYQQVQAVDTSKAPDITWPTKPE